jgi:hypothetical protein
MPARRLNPQHRTLCTLLLVLLAAPLPAFGPVLVEGSRGAAVFDPWRWQAVGQLDSGGQILCPDQDGEHVWSPDPAAPQRLRRLSLKNGKPDGPAVEAKGPIVALESDPEGRRLYALAMPASATAGDRGEVLWVDLKAATILARQSLIGLPRALLLLPAEEPREAQLLVAAWVPDLKTGMLYALDLALIQVLSSQVMPGDPRSIRYAPALRSLADPAAGEDEAQAVELDASGDSPAAALPAPARPLSATAKALPASPTAKPAEAKRNGLLSGSFAGQVLDAVSNEPLPRAKVTALNRRGKAYPGVVDGQGRYRIDGLPYGTYQLLAEAEGHQARRLADKTLALTSEERVDLKLEPARAASEEPKP